MKWPFILGFLLVFVSSSIHVESATANRCAVNPCKNGGKCINSENGKRYTCECIGGYLGKNCQNAPPCAANPCKNGGTCTNDGEDYYICDCIDGHLGDDCEIGISCTAANQHEVCTQADSRCNVKYGLCYCKQGWLVTGDDDCNGTISPDDCAEAQYSNCGSTALCKANECRCRADESLLENPIWSGSCPIPDRFTLGIPCTANEMCTQPGSSCNVKPGLCYCKQGWLDTGDNDCNDTNLPIECHDNGWCQDDAFCKDG
eukprot:182536_1